MPGCHPNNCEWFVERELMKTPPTFDRNEFRKASRSQSDGTNCVLVARRDRWVEVRDSKQWFGGPDDVRLVFDAEEFDEFLAGIRAGDLTGHCVEIVDGKGDTHLFRSTVPQHGQHTLCFTDAELFACYDGVHRGEFAESAYTG